MNRNDLPEVLKPWSLPPSYGGKTWDGWRVFLGCNRDSDILTDSNFEKGFEAVCAASTLTDEDFMPQIVRENHWACGWVEWIAIHESDKGALTEGGEIVCALANYPILDESDFSNREREAAEENWKNSTVKERYEAIKRYGSEVSVFAARYDTMPYDDNGGLSEYFARNF